MVLRYVLDEQLRGVAWRTLQRCRFHSHYPLDVTCVGESADLPLGTKDPALLIWAAQANRVLVSVDTSTMPQHFGAHLAAGRHSPGVFLVRAHAGLKEVVDYLQTAAYASLPGEWRDRIKQIP